MAIQLETRAEGILLPVRASAGAGRNELRGEHNGHLKVSVTQVPEKGKANAAIARVLCQSLGLKRSQLALVSGETSPAKQYLVTGISLADFQARLAAALAE